MFYYNEKLLVIGNFKKIISISDSLLAFEYKRYNLIIEGNNLLMPYLEDKEVGIKGIIKHISFEYKLGNENA